MFTVALLVFSCGEKKETKAASKKIIEVSTEIPIFNYEGLKPLLNLQDDKIHVINFWATWCKPCVDELPYFENLNEDYNDKGVEVTLVSLDFPNQIESQLMPFIEKNKIKSKVVVLDDPKQNVWINAIDPTWSGSIPATIIYTKDKRAFYEQSFDEKTLKEALHKFLN